MTEMILGQKGQQRIDIPLQASGLWSLQILDPLNFPIYSGSAGDRSTFLIHSAKTELKRWPWWKGYWQIRRKIKAAFKLHEWGVFPKSGMRGAVLGKPFELDQHYELAFRDRTGKEFRCGLRVKGGAKGIRLQTIGAGPARRLQVSVA